MYPHLYENILGEDWSRVVMSDTSMTVTSGSAILCGNRFLNSGRINLQCDMRPLIPTDGKPERFYGGIKHKCSHCGANWKEDQRGNCKSCGAPE